MMHCPLCGSSILAEVGSQDQIDAEICLRRQFIWNRLNHHPEPAELKDLTDFMHGGSGRLLQCVECRSILREEDHVQGYVRDPFDSELVKFLYPRYVSAFEAKEDRYRPLIRNSAEVLEVGSHYGSFLQVAEQWNWKPTGLDIGKDAYAFTRKSGFAVRRQILDEYHARLSKSDAVFFWNCFEQIANPMKSLLLARQLLQPWGLIVVRVPNVDFYRMWSRLLWRSDSPEAVRKLGYNNLLGFPYANGYNSRSLHRFLRGTGFQPMIDYGSKLLTIPLPEMSQKVANEAQAAWASGASSPWIEVVARKEDI